MKHDTGQHRKVRDIKDALRTCIWWGAILAICSGCGGTSSSGDTHEEIEPVSLAGLVLNPASAPPGAPVALEGFPQLPEDAAWSIALGEVEVPLLTGEGGYFIPAPLVFPDGSPDWPTAPEGPLPLILYRNGTEYERIEDAFTLQELEPAAGTTRALRQTLSQAAEDLSTITELLADTPGAMQQYMASFLGSLEELISGTGDNSLASQLEALESSGYDGVCDAMLASSGLDEYFEAYAEFLDQYATAFGRVSAARQRAARTAGLAVPQISDELLAYQMQFYEVARMFGQEVINATGTQFGNTLGAVLGALGTVGVAVPVAATTMTVTGAILFYMDFMVNKILVGLLPAKVDSIELEFASLVLANDEVSDATITINASNVQPSLSLNDLVGTALNMMGWAGSSAAPQSIVDVLEGITVFLTTTMQSLFSQYASANPGLNLDVNLAATVPAITWSATGNDTRLFDCISLAPSLLTPIANDLNWQADSTARGDGVVYVRTATDAGARIVPLPPGFIYTGGAFGNDVGISPNVTLTVDELDVSMEIVVGIVPDNPYSEDPYLSTSFTTYEDVVDGFMHTFQTVDGDPAAEISAMSFDQATCEPVGGDRYLPGTSSSFVTSVGSGCGNASQQTIIDIDANGLSGAITLSSTADASYPNWGGYPIGCASRAGLDLSPHSVVVRIENNSSDDVELTTSFESIGEILPPDPCTYWNGYAFLMVDVVPEICTVPLGSLGGEMLVRESWAQDLDLTGTHTMTLVPGTHHIGIRLMWELFTESTNGCRPDPPVANTTTSGQIDGAVTFEIRQP